MAVAERRHRGSMHIVLEYTVCVALVLIVAALLFAACVALIMIHAGAVHLGRFLRTLQVPYLFRRGFQVSGTEPVLKPARQASN
jgi:hypothetical protein